MDDRTSQGLNWVKMFGWVLSLAALAFVGRWLWQADRQVWSYFRSLNVWAALLSLAIFQMWFGLRFVGWHTISRWYGVSGSTGSNMKMWTLSELLRYIPGNIWSFAARWRGARDRGASRSGAGVALAVEALNLVIGAAVVAAWFWRPGWWWLWACVMLIVVATLPTVLSGLARWRGWEEHHRLTIRQSSMVILLYLLVWISYGLAQSVLIAAVPGISAPPMPILIGANVGAWLLGYVSIVTPMGLGVREVAFVFLLRHSVSESVASILALVTRVWLILCELVFLGLVMIFSRKR